MRMEANTFQSSSRRTGYVSKKSKVATLQKLQEQGLIKSLTRMNTVIYSFEAVDVNAVRQALTKNNVEFGFKDTTKA